MDNNVKACVLTAHNNTGWYEKGQQRLINSLRHHGFSHDIVSFSMRSVGLAWNFSVLVNGTTYASGTISEYTSDCPYTLKAAAFHYVSRVMGYDTILWLDCSVYAIKPIEPVFDIIARDGHYFWRSGWSLGHTCKEEALRYFGITRDQAFDIQDCSTSMFGLKLSNPDSDIFLNAWLRSARDRMFHGSRDQIAAGDVSQKIHFFAHRQDQSCATALIHNIGLTMHDAGQISQYANETGEYPETVRLVMRGI